MKILGKTMVCNSGKYAVYLRGSRKYIFRNVYGGDDMKTWIVFCGKLIEVGRYSAGYYTIEEY